MRRLQLGSISALAFALAACQTVPTNTASAPAESTADPQSILDGSIVPHVTHNFPETPKKVSPYAPAVEDPSTRGNYVAGGLYKPGVKDSIAGITVDAHLIPEPDVVHLERSAIGNKPSYTVLGKEYRVMDDTRGFKEVGLASYYGKKFHGRLTSNREVYDMYAFSAAHKSLPIPSFARITNLDNGQSVVVRVNDRGPFHDGRVVDLSLAAATKIGIVAKGTGRVSVEALQPTGPSYASNPLMAKANPNVIAQATLPSQPAAPVYVPAAAVSTSATVTTASPTVVPATSTTAVVTSSAAVMTATVPAAKPEFRPEAARFNMSQNGQQMSADHFDAWMKEQKITIATGKPRAVDAAPIAATTDQLMDQAVANTTAPEPVMVASASAVTTATAAPGPGEVILQVASFSSEANAMSARDRLLAAGITGAMLQDGMTTTGAKIWRLRVGPVAVAESYAVIEQISRLGLGKPQRVM